MCTAVSIAGAMREETQSLPPRKSLKASCGIPNSAVEIVHFVDRRTGFLKNAIPALKVRHSCIPGDHFYSRDEPVTFLFGHPGARVGQWIGERHLQFYHIVVDTRIALDEAGGFTERIAVLVYPRAVVKSP